jgi:hypothetical protein
MATTSSFAAQFPEAEFRDAIRQTMLMGMPESDAEKLVWHWDRQKTWEPQSPSGHPYNLNATPVTDLPGSTAQDPEDDGLIVDYILEDNNTEQTDTTQLGLIDFGKIKITIFDTDWERVKTADYATIGDTRYQIDTTAPPEALFGVTMHTIFLEVLEG